MKPSERFNDKQLINILQLPTAGTRRDDVNMRKLIPQS